MKVIAEFKRAPFGAYAGPDVAERVAAYEAGGAYAVSVVVETQRFFGTWQDLERARDATKLPLLAKGFFGYERDLRRAKECGADAVLLLVQNNNFNLLARAAHEMGLYVLAEASDGAEVAQATACAPWAIGVNQRKFPGGPVDEPETVHGALRCVRPPALAVWESGLTCGYDVRAAALAGAEAVLIGTWFVTNDDPEAAVREAVEAA